MFLSKSVEIGGRTLTFETGEMAKQADGAVVVKYGDTMVLVTAVMSRRKMDNDFLPLTVDYSEKMYTAGRIPGGYFRREGKATETDVLTSRLIDRPIRPLFPKGCRNEIQVMATVLSMDRENDPGIMSICGASAALMCSDMPWAGPVAALKVGRLDGKFVANPKMSEIAKSDIDMTVAVGREGIVMVEGGAKYVSEEDLVDALMFAQEQAQPILAIQEQMAAELNLTKRTLELPVEDEELAKDVYAKAKPIISAALAVRVKKQRQAAMEEAAAKTQAMFAESHPGRAMEINRYYEKALKKIARAILVDTGHRIDGRLPTDIRPITTKVGVLPRVHGSALFTRGETQALVSVTLGTSQDEQRVEGLGGNQVKRYMLHYNFPSFSTGEVKPNRGPSRRDVGHGHLAERGTGIVVPEKEAFPYVVRVVSEILESNGSSSMATVCGASLAMMDAGVPISSPVAGVAMGLLKEGDKVFVLSDILGDEDHLGDMDFKVVGNEHGISAVQMDIKITGLDRSIMQRALSQAKEARIHILGKMAESITAPRPELSMYAPRITTLQIRQERIKDLIGPGGKNIRNIVDTTGVQIEVKDDGTVYVAATDGEAAKKAINMIHGLTASAEVGKTYLGKVVKIADFGAFVEILPGVQGLCHISELADHKVRCVEDILREGDEVYVKVTDVDNHGKVRVSRREALRQS